jgi:hypothetical protein
MSQKAKVVQFVHPGFEYHRRKYIGPHSQRFGVMQWKVGLSEHDRKFMWHMGSALDPRTGGHHVDLPLTFWGEWEGPSLFWKIDSPGKPLARVVHAPFRPAEYPTTSVQNTDPMVFGETFIYSNCRQGRHPLLRALPVGSLILFGRLGRKQDEERSHFFALDTCLVVDRVRRLPARPFDESSYGSDIVEDAALCPLHTEGERGDLGVHSGRTRAQGGIFSFFPAQVSQDTPSLFARPELRPVGALERIISPGTQGIKVTHNLSQTELQTIWNAVVNQVTEQGCTLGYRAFEPPFLSDDDMRRLAEGPPKPLTPSATKPSSLTMGATLQ